MHQSKLLFPKYPNNIHLHHHNPASVITTEVRKKKEKGGKEEENLQISASNTRNWDSNAPFKNHISQKAEEKIEEGREGREGERERERGERDEIVVSVMGKREMKERYR